MSQDSQQLKDQWKHDIGSGRSPHPHQKRGGIVAKPPADQATGRDLLAVPRSPLNFNEKLRTKPHSLDDACKGTA